MQLDSRTKELVAATTRNLPEELKEIAPSPAQPWITTITRDFDNDGVQEALIVKQTDDNTLTLLATDQSSKEYARLRLVVTGEMELPDKAALDSSGALTSASTSLELRGKLAFGKDAFVKAVDVDRDNLTDLVVAETSAGNESVLRTYFNQGGLQFQSENVF
jgi:hypothetical protein